MSDFKDYAYNMIFKYKYFFFNNTSGIIYLNSSMKF